MASAFGSMYSKCFADGGDGGVLAQSQLASKTWMSEVSAKSHSMTSTSTQSQAPNIPYFRGEAIVATELQEPFATKEIQTASVDYRSGKEDRGPEKPTVDATIALTNKVQAVVSAVPVQIDAQVCRFLMPTFFLVSVHLPSPMVAVHDWIPLLYGHACSRWSSRQRWHLLPLQQFRVPR